MSLAQSISAQVYALAAARMQAAAVKCSDDGVDGKPAVKCEWRHGGFKYGVYMLCGEEEDNDPAEMARALVEAVENNLACAMPGGGKL